MIENIPLCSSDFTAGLAATDLIERRGVGAFTVNGDRCLELRLN